MENNIKDLLESTEKLLEEYENRIHLKIKCKEVDLDITSEDLSRLNNSDIHFLCFSWAQYSLFLQKEINRLQARLSWTKSNLERLTDKESVNYKGFTFQERKSAVIDNNEAAKKLYKLKENTEMAINRLNFIPSKIDFLIKIAQNISYSRIKEEKKNDQG